MKILRGIKTLIIVCIASILGIGLGKYLYLKINAVKGLDVSNAILNSTLNFKCISCNVVDKVEDEDSYMLVVDIGGTSLDVDSSEYKYNNVSVGDMITCIVYYDGDNISHAEYK